MDKPTAAAPFDRSADRVDGHPGDDLPVAGQAPATGASVVDTPCLAAADEARPAEAVERSKATRAKKPKAAEPGDAVEVDPGPVDRAELPGAGRQPEPSSVGRARTTIADPPRFGRHYRPPGVEGEEGGPAAGGGPSAGSGIDGSAPDGVDESGGGFVGHLASVAEPVVNAVEPIVEHVVMPVAGAIGNVIEAASQAFGVRDAISERLNRTPEPLPNLYDIHPEARLASPRELGFRFVPIEDIRGTAVAGAAQRGGDFLPLPPFRGSNWQARWQRIRGAYRNLQPLPPVDLIKFDGEYWVVDGHNRVAATLVSKGVGLDAMVVELVPMDGQVSERPSSVLAFIGEAGALRAAAQGNRPAVGTRVSNPTSQSARPERSREGARRRSAGTAQGADGAPSRQPSDAGGTETETR